MNGCVRIEIAYDEARAIRDDAWEKVGALGVDLEMTMKIDDLDARRYARKVLLRKRELYEELANKMQAAGELFEYKGRSCDECMSGESC